MPCNGRQILNQWTTREVPFIFTLDDLPSSEVSAVWMDTGTPVVFLGQGQKTVLFEYNRTLRSKESEHILTTCSMNGLQKQS